MSEPIPVKVTRYRCPTCPRTGSSKARIREHHARCWTNPEARGCKTCKHFEEATDDRCDAPYGCGACHDIPESCAVDVSLAGRPECGIKPGPIVGCDRWERAENGAA